MVERESRVHTMLHIYPMYGIFYLPGIDTANTGESRDGSRKFWWGGGYDVFIFNETRYSGAN